ncbi:MAG: ATP-binding protein [Magnetococcus sp. MYC-9]
MATILLVDDQPELIDVVLSVLRKDYEVRVAINGESALQIAARGDIDLILLDVVMPEMGGHEVCRRLKQDPVTRNIPVIFLTGRQDAEDEATGFALGGVDYIHKPPNFHLLRARVSSQLELKRHRDHLEALVQERTQALEQINQQLQTANQAKADFLMVISHEMRTPLNAVIGFSDCLLSDAQLNEEHRSFVRLIHDSGKHLLANINDIIDFVRMSSSGLLADRVAFDLLDHLQEVVELLQGDADRKGLPILVEVEERLPRKVLGDPRRLGQVLRHLLHNAIKFTERGCVTVRLAVTPLPDRARCHFTVEDTGCGIPEDKIPHVFQQFTQAESPYTRKQDGFGLGLAICQKLVLAMSGQLQVVRSDASGTLLSFVVDLAWESADPDE